MRAKDGAHAFLRLVGARTTIARGGRGVSMEASVRKCLAGTGLLVAMAVTGCVNPLPFGPGRVQVALDAVTVQRVTRGTLLPDSDPNWRDRPANVVRFDVSSETNLARYFDDWDRMVQTRCFVTGAEDGRRYKGFAVGPLQEGVDISMLGTRRKEALSFAPDAAGKYRYTLYAFVDLTADDKTYVNGKPRGTLDLTSQRFSSLGCFVIGVTMAPLIFPRTNTVTVSERDIRDGISKLGGG